MKGPPLFTGEEREERKGGCGRPGGGRSVARVDVREIRKGRKVGG